MTETPNKESAKAVDDTLKLFSGDVIIKLIEIEQQHGHRSEKYHQIENCLKVLHGDNMIKLYRDLRGNYVLDNKGWWVLSNINHLGYEARYNAIVANKKLDSDRFKINFQLQVAIAVLTIIGIIVTVVVAC